MKLIAKGSALSAFSFPLVSCLLLGLISISSTAPSKLRIYNKATLQTTINANFPFENLQIEALDADDNRIETGDDSSLTITAILSDSKVCLADSSFKLMNGIGTFMGSVCEVTSEMLTITFKDVKNNIISDATPNITVTGDIYIASFLKDNMEFAAESARWIKLYLAMYNEGILAPYFKKELPDRTFKHKNYLHYGTHHGAFNAFSEMKSHEKANPHEKSHTIIGTSDNEVTKLLLPLFTRDKYALTSFRLDDDESFSDKKAYPYFNRLTASKSYMYHAIGLILRDRKWNKVVVISDENTTPSPEMEKRFSRLGVDIIREYSISNSAIPSVDKMWKENPIYDHIFEDIKASGTQIILSFAYGNAAHTLYGSAMRNNVTSQDDFQWILIGEGPQGNFPIHNDIPMCHSYEEKYPAGLNTWCNYRFRGTNLLTSLGQYSDGGVSLEWFVAQLEYYTSNPLLVHGGTLFNAYPLRPVSFIADVAKVYDSAKLNVNAIKQLISEKKTITGDLIATTIRGTKLSGLSAKEVQFDTDGDSLSYAMEMKVIYPRWDWRYLYWGSYEQFEEYRITYKLLPDWYFGALNWDFHPVQDSRVIFFKGNKEDDLKAEIESYSYEKGSYFTDRGMMRYFRLQISSGHIILDPAKRQKRTYNSYIGMFVKGEQKLREEYWRGSWRYVPDELPFEVVTKEEMIPPNWWCNKGCGGAQTDENNRNIYPNGECVSRNKCVCNKDQERPGKFRWGGDTCEIPLCNEGCLKGTCTEPNTCKCREGYDTKKSKDCSIPICSGCDDGGGVCIAPEMCVCKPNYYGESCKDLCNCGQYGTCNEGVQGDGACTCESGYAGEHCDIPFHLIIGATIGGIFGVLILLGIIIKLNIKRTQNKAVLENNDWIVNWNDLKKHDEITGRSSMFLSALSMNQNKTKKQGNTGVWNGIDVHYQRLEKDSVPVSKEVRFDVKKVKELRHVNIIPLVGACLEAPNVCILTEAATKGSLEDLLTNEDIRIPWDFRYPIMKGICQGMSKIHSSEIGSHGRLKSSNILIDGRWTPKITGFGLQTIRQGAKNVGEFDHDNPMGNTVNMEKSNYGSLLWTAPELLLNGYYHIDHVGKGTQENDIYSFGMLMAEICTRDHPFADVMLEKPDIISLIKGQQNEAALKVWNDYIAQLNMEAGGLVRPCIKDNEWPKKFEQRKALKKLMDNCWHHDPSQRPTMRDCISEIERIDPQQTEIMDRLVKMLEKYSTNLEDVVTKRTKQLAREKQKTEDLVSRLLPKSVAEDLKQGKRVEPENFESVTIFFSDIVGFTSIARSSTPLQVVTLLNDMYTSFDSISANYDAYKVETIGDAYMIVSGLPTRNGDKHAGEIATCAMDLICSISDFKIRHMPDTIMQLRVGLHTGYVVAGVVGLKMPRYCLFGDTVQIAAKMESGGAAMRIHISEDTVAVLKRLGGYQIEYRGETEVKNRGLVKTYWLTGKEDYGKPLPVPPPLEEE